MSKLLTIFGVLSISFTAMSIASAQEIPRILDKDIKRVDLNTTKIPEVKEKEFYSCQRQAVVLISSGLEISQVEKNKLSQKLKSKGHLLMDDDRDNSFPLGTIFLVGSQTTVIDQESGEQPLLVDMNKVEKIINNYKKNKHLSLDDLKAVYLDDATIGSMKLKARVTFDVRYKSFSVTNKKALIDFDYQWKKIIQENPNSGFDDGLPVNDTVGTVVNVNVPVTASEVKKAQLNAAEQMLNLTGGQELDSHMGDLNLMGVLMSLEDAPDLTVRGLQELVEILPDCNKEK